MALIEKNLWHIDSRVGSSMDTSGSYGGLTAGRIDLPANHKKVKAYKVRIGGKTLLESYASFNAMLTAIGGRSVPNLSGTDEIIEFDTKSTTNGARGIYSVEGVFVKEWHPHEALTKGEAERLVMTHGLDVYSWDGTSDVKAGAKKNLIELGLSTDIAQGNSTIKASDLVALPVDAKSRALLITVSLDGQFEGNGPHDFRVMLTDPDGTTSRQTVPMYSLDSKLDCTTANFSVYTNGVYDEFSTTGFKLVFVNDSQSKVTLSTAKIVVQSISNPDFTRT